MGEHSVTYSGQCEIVPIIRIVGTEILRKHVERLKSYAKW